MEEHPSLTEARDAAMKAAFLEEQARLSKLLEGNRHERRKAEALARRKAK